MRDQIHGSPSPPYGTGDLAYRATVKTDVLRDLADPDIDKLLETADASLWMGPEKHCLLYPLRNRTEYNLILLRPDNMPPGARTVAGDLQEMQDTFQGWDSRITKIISTVESVLKWRLCHHEELRSWTRGSVALLGDACHPSLPYQAQGAAQAVEDGVVLGVLLGSLTRSKHLDWARSVPKVLQLYESLRKPRTTLNVQGAIRNRGMFHVSDDEERERRNAALRAAEDTECSDWTWTDNTYMRDMLGYDAAEHALMAFEQWSKDQDGHVNL